MFSFRKRDCRTTTKLGRQARDGCVAPHDYTNRAQGRQARKCGGEVGSPRRLWDYTKFGMQQAKPNLWGVLPVAVCGLSLLTAASAAAQSPKPLQMSPGELVHVVVANEVAASNNTAIKHMFRSRKQTPKGSQTRLYVETDDAMAGMLVAINDERLTPQQEQGEMNHLAWLMNNPDQLRKKKARENEDQERTLRIVKALPDAFRYEYAGTQPGVDGIGRAGAELVRLNFSPNPAYAPPSHVEQVLQAMRGFLLIDPERLRIAVIDGMLFKDVTFGWGLIGRLEKGGHFRVRQADLGDGSWDITEMDLNITGKILLFKTLTMVSDEVFSDFRRVPDKLTFAQGVELLKTEQEKLAGARRLEASGTKKTP
jgi:hypothetical protein